MVAQQTQVAARYGAWKYSRGEDLGSIENSIKNNFFPKKKGNVKVCDPSLAFSNPWDYDSDDKEKILQALLNILGIRLTYGIEVSYNMPIKLGSFNLESIGIKEAKIRSAHFIDGNTWEYERTTIHEPLDIFWDQIKKVFNKFSGMGKGPKIPSW
ncbi:MAG: hypothetical protein PF482_02695 [Desulfobacteraceae bacterium]|jgi:hypothetical protein|nr:hypothetical protein [Desulfobacteraceae bacterium]